VSKLVLEEPGVIQKLTDVPNVTIPVKLVAVPQKLDSSELFLVDLADLVHHVKETDT